MHHQMISYSPIMSSRSCLNHAPLDDILSPILCWGHSDLDDISLVQVASKNWATMYYSSWVMTCGVCPESKFYFGKLLHEGFLLQELCQYDPSESSRDLACSTALTRMHPPNWCIVYTIYMVVSTTLMKEISVQEIFTMKMCALTSMIIKWTYSISYLY